MKYNKLLLVNEKFYTLNYIKCLCSTTDLWTECKISGLHCINPKQC